MTTRREFLKTMGLGAASLVLPTCAGLPKDKGERPNILFIMTDDHTIQAMGCYGSKINKTPNMDRIAEQGARFDMAYCTNSICAPSRAVLLTGKYSHINGLIDNRVKFDGAQQTFPKLLRKAGYETAVVGKWHLKTDPTGFDFWKILPGQGHYYNPDFIEMGVKKREPGYVTDLITDFSLDWLKSRNQEKPFCLLLHHKAPHRSWMPNLKHLDLYKDGDIPVPETFFDDYKNRSRAAMEQEMTVAEHMRLGLDLKVRPDESRSDLSEEEKRAIQSMNHTYGRMDEAQRTVWDGAYQEENRAFLKAGLKDRELALWKYQRYIKDYLRCIASVDENIGRVLDYLDHAGLADNTVVVYTSDQGFYLGEHGWFDKRFMYKESHGVPLLWRYPPEVAPGVKKKDMALNLDFAPTFLDYAGTSIPEDMQGASLRRVLQGDTPDDWRRSVYYHYFEYPAVHAVKRHYGVRTHRYKLMRFYYDINAWEFYDLKKDPDEMNNIYDDPAYLDVIKELKEELRRLQTRYKDIGWEKYLPKSSISLEHKAKGKPVEHKIPFSKKYTGGGPGALTDGMGAPNRMGTLPNYTVWQGFEGTDMEAVVDLEAVSSVTETNAGFLQNVEDWVFAPASVEYSFSLDGKAYFNAVKIKNSFPLKRTGLHRRSFRKRFKDLFARYIRVKARNIRVCPDWHPGKGGPAWIFSDEIVVR